LKSSYGKNTVPWPTRYAPRSSWSSGNGRSVVRQGARGLGEQRRASEADARERFAAEIRQAIDDGFVPVARDPVRATPARPRPPTPPPAPAALPAPVSVPAPDGDERGEIGVNGAAISVCLDDLAPPSWADVCARPPAPRATHVELEVMDDADYVFDVVAREGLPGWATGVTLATFEGVETFLTSTLEVDRIWPHVGRLIRLELRAGRIRLPPELPRAAAPELAHLELWCSHAEPAMIEGLAAAPWPALRVLRLWLAPPARPGLAARALDPLWSRSAFPALEHVQIFGVSDWDHLVDRVRASELGDLRSFANLPATSIAPARSPAQ